MFLEKPNLTFGQYPIYSPKSSKKSNFGQFAIHLKKADEINILGSWNLLRDLLFFHPKLRGFKFYNYAFFIFFIKEKHTYYRIIELFHKITCYYFHKCGQVCPRKEYWRLIIIGKRLMVSNTIGLQISQFQFTMNDKVTMFNGPMVACSNDLKEQIERPGCFSHFLKLIDITADSSNAGQPYQGQRSQYENTVDVFILPVKTLQQLKTVCVCFQNLGDLFTIEIQRNIFIRKTTQSCSHTII